MKVKNFFICILNLIEVVILALLTETVFNYIHVYSLYMFILRAVWYIVGIVNIIYGINNIRNKKTAIGILFMIIGISTLSMILINHTEICYRLDSDLSQIINYISLGISGILSIIIIILNRKLENNNKNKCTLAIFITIIFINVLIISLISIFHFANVKKFEKYVLTMQDGTDSNTYIVHFTDECIFLDENGNEINRKNYKNIFTNLQFSIKGKLTNLITATTNDGKEIILNNKGEELYSIYTGIPIDTLEFSIMNLDDSDFIFSKTTVLDNFLYYLVSTNKYDFKTANFLVNSNKILNYNVLEKYNETNKEFEDNPNYSYLYFKNNNISNYTLQVAITNKSESDNSILNYYEENCEYYNKIDFDKMYSFYNYQKEFYIIDFTTNTKIKLDCKNLLYEAYSGDERIVLLSNGYIPFYDKNENGYFTFQGQKVSVAPNYILYDFVGDNIIIIDKKTNKTLILSSKDNNIIKELDYPLTRYNGFYIAYTDDYSYNILFDNDFNIISDKSTITLIGNNFITLETQSYNTTIYRYDKNSISKVNINSDKRIISLISSNNSTALSSNIYSNIGIVAPAIN